MIGKGINSAPTNPAIGINTDTKKIRLVINTPLTISFAIALTAPLKGVGEIRFAALRPNCLAKFDCPYIRQKGNRSSPFDCVG